MSPQSKAHRRRLLPLHVTLATAFVSLFVVFGLVLTVFNHLENQSDIVNIQLLMLHLALFNRPMGAVPDLTGRWSVEL